MKHEVERTLRTIFKRCVVCPEQGPVCPKCSPGNVCSLVPRDCNQCAYMTCIQDPSQSSGPSRGPNVGAIAGGVVGGIAFVSLIVFLVWRLWIKKRREEQDRELEEKWQSDGAARRLRVNGPSDAALTRTRASLATSILSRASNVIQIAYIPGVMDRRGSRLRDDSTPVPPIPAAFRSGQQTPKSPLSKEGDMLFFRPGDLRDSTWSDSSSFRVPGNRDTQYTMQSITPSLARSSVASDVVFYDDATTTPMPAQIFRPSAPRMVSIKPLSSTPESEEPEEKKPQMIHIKVPGQESKNLTGSIVKASQVQIGGNGKGKNRIPIANAINGNAKYAPVTRSPLADVDNTAEQTQDEHNSARQSLLRPSTPTEILISPFDDPSESSPTTKSASSSPRPNPYASMASTIRRSGDYGAKRRTRSIGGLSAVIEEASRKASNPASTESLREEAERAAKTGHDSPFGDEHAVD